MLVVLSPAKKLDWDRGADMRMTTPGFQADAVDLAHEARKLGPDGLKKLMKISPALADLNARRFAEFTPDPDTSTTRPAIHAFAGDTYTGLDASSLDADALDWAKGHLRILSGLYGVLRPFDGIQPYRLEMGSRLATARGKTLYDWWGDRIARQLAQDATEAGTRVLVNCASVEYFGAVDQDALGLEVVTPVFLDARDGAEPKQISFFAKKARGAMARFILEHRADCPQALADFQTGGYAYQPDRSTPTQPVFLRES